MSLEEFSKTEAGFGLKKQEYQFLGEKKKRKKLR